MNHSILYLDNPATAWDNGTPVGCGSLGAMLFGRVDQEILQLNEESIWAAQKHNPVDPDFRDKIDQMRDMLLRGEPCDEWAQENLKDSFGFVGSYETAGEVHLCFDHSDYTDYARRLYMDRGAAEVTYRCGNVVYKRTVFASHPSKLIALHLDADHANSLTFTVKYVREGIRELKAADDELIATACTACGTHPFTVRIRVIADGGRSDVSDGSIRVWGADRCTLLIAIGCGHLPERPAMEDYRSLLSAHETDFSALFCRSDLCSADDPKADVPVRNRLAAVRNGEDDPGLIPLYFAFGKYLLISSSREDTLPANLQGVWCKDITAPWNSDYHTNINLQMNYWPAYVANLAPCGLALAAFMTKTVLPGAKKAARELYHCNGAVLHHLTDIYGFAAPADGVWGLWPLGGGWMCRSLWEGYLFTEDIEYLRSIYDFLRECAVFYMDYLFEVNGKLYSGPSASPENRYSKDGQSQYLCISPTMDTEIIGDCFQIFCQAAEIVGADAELSSRVREAAERLPKLNVGERGQLMEWLEDYDECEPGHRHISHAYALYPGCAIRRETPQLRDAIARTIELRLQNGGGHTGWSAAWLVCLFARLNDRDGVERMLRQLFSKSTLDNLLDRHPPFQIDGNFGGAAGIAEALLQSHEDSIVLLPAVPESLKCASFRGFLARGGVEVSAEWRDGRVTSCSLLSPTDRTVTLEVNQTSLRIALIAGKTAEMTF